MPTADDYADWIVKNKSKRGTPEFQTVAAAYQEAKAEEEGQKEQSWGTAIQRGISRVPGQLAEFADMASNIRPSSLVEGIANIAPTPQNLLRGQSPLTDIETYKSIAMAPIERYGTSERAKETIATDPLGAMMDVSLAGATAGRALQQFPRAAKIGAALEKTSQAIDPLSIASRVVTKPFRELASININVPTAEQLRARKTEAYQRARNAGVVFTPKAFEDFVKGLRTNLRDESGNLVPVVPELHADANAALSALEKYTGSAMTLDDLEDMRRIISDAAASPKPADRRVAMLMKERLDDFVEAPPPGAVSAGNAKEGAEALAEARDAYSRLRKSEFIDDLIRNAELSAPNFSASGMENALRTEFRRIAKNPKQMRLFTQAERAAIEDVAKGGSVTNVLRMVGKFTPTGVVSGSLSTGLGAGLGFMAGGPVGSGIGAVTLPAIGAVSRVGATGLTQRAANRASEVMRAGREGVTASQRLAYLLQNYGDKLSKADPSAAFAVDMARRTIAAGRQVDPYYARQLAAQLARLQDEETEK